MTTAYMVRLFCRDSHASPSGMMTPASVSVCVIRFALVHVAVVMTAMVWMVVVVVVVMMMMMATFIILVIVWSLMMGGL